ncbi:acylphosphatase [Gloeomargarita lithophora Alchichica-D10]|uniref:acylphosphatase n=1 Tax=Gloeomargarita lithophora Alchichica-D10 TaxID=1188229 RepID=A0A1J0AFK0_9CYAN|nr:acylphosphatase [Gloeomargarita lithophora]APB34716.1 acylphosphatase [Gloeomargarita lithophora Alchichica-D10]
MPFSSGAVQVWISGRVQGVGYRAATRQQALALGLTGWVQNLPDGRVTAVFAGEAVAVQKMVDWCHQGSALAQVTQVMVEPYSHSLSPGFTIS